jgi:hypothetical protein
MSAFRDAFLPGSYPSLLRTQTALGQLTEHEMEKLKCLIMVETAGSINHQLNQWLVDPVSGSKLTGR